MCGSVTLIAYLTNTRRPHVQPHCFTSSQLESLASVPIVPRFPGSFGVVLVALVMLESVVDHVDVYRRVFTKITATV